MGGKITEFKYVQGKQKLVREIEGSRNQVSTTY